jgi:hypothetical protein
MKILFIICILTPVLSYGQMLLNPRGEILEDLPFFNADFIKERHVKSFKGFYSTKFDNDIIRNNDDAFVYEFDKLGQLVRKYKILLGDTLLSTYSYDYRGNVVIHRETNKLGYYEYRYSFDEQDRVTELEVRRDKKTNQNKLSFELDESAIISVEKYAYIPLEGKDYKKVCYNGVGRVYRIEFYYFNTKGQLAKIESALHNGTGRKEVNYFYDQNGRIEELKIISKATKTHTKRKLFTYDDLGNVLSRHMYRNNKLISEEQLVYFEESNLLKAVISRDSDNAMLTILKFNHYRYF